VAERNDPRRIWSTNLAPLFTAAREGAAQAARTASRERARARRDSRRGRRTWLIVTAAGMVVAGAAGGAYQAAKRRAAGSGAAGAEPGQGGTPAQTIISTVESGREKVAEAARTMLHKIRGNGADQSAPARTGAASGSPPAGTPAAESRSRSRTGVSGQ
jgi:hypothetical protein